MEGEKKLLGWKNPKIVIAILGILAITAIVSFALLRERFVAYPREMSFNGVGKVSYAPDTAQISLGVEVLNSALADTALNQLNTTMNKIIDEVKKIGKVEEKDIQTQTYSLSASIEYPPYPVPMTDMSQGMGNVTSQNYKKVTYNATQTLVITVRDITSDSNKTIENIIATASKAGANQINGITFTSSKIEDFKQEARLKAIEEAKKRAKSLSKILGVRLTKIVSWWENPNYVQALNNYDYYGKGGGAMGESMSPSIPTGSQEIIMEVNLNYRVK